MSDEDVLNLDPVSEESSIDEPGPSSASASAEKPKRKRRGTKKAYRRRKALRKEAEMKERLVQLVGRDVREPGKPGAVDSHFHLDRLLHMAGKESLLEIQQGKEEKVKLHRMVAVYCDPPGWSKAVVHMHMDDRLVFTIKVHPKGVGPGTLTAAHLAQLYKLLSEDKCVGLGEIGLDWTHHMWQRDHQPDCQKCDMQERVFQSMLEVARDTGKAVILHLRGYRKEETKAVYLKGLAICKRVLPKAQRIVFHCYTQDLSVALEWKEQFPHVHLGINTLSTKEELFRRNLEGLLGKNGFDPRHILLETDAPYLLPRGESMPTTMWALGAVLRHVARVMNVSEEAAMELTRMNACSFYDMSW